jgi:hypothetical protein
MMMGVLGSLAVVLSYVMFVTPVSGTITQSQGAAVDPLQPLAFLVGRWEGSSEGQPGKASVQREYTRILNSRFIRVQNKSVYPPQDKNPKGETHEDVGVFSFDKSRGRAVFRQFHVEGYVNQYVAMRISSRAESSSPVKRSRTSRPDIVPAKRTWCSAQMNSKRSSSWRNRGRRSSCIPARISRAFDSLRRDPDARSNFSTLPSGHSKTSASLPWPIRRSPCFERLCAHEFVRCVFEEIRAISSAVEDSFGRPQHLRSGESAAWPCRLV